MHRFFILLEHRDILCIFLHTKSSSSYMAVNLFGLAVFCAMLKSYCEELKIIPQTV